MGIPVGLVGKVAVSADNLAEGNLVAVAAVNTSAETVGNPVTALSVDKVVMGTGAEADTLAGDTGASAGVGTLVPEGTLVAVDTVGN